MDIGHKGSRLHQFFSGLRSGVRTSTGDAAGRRTAGGQTAHGKSSTTSSFADARKSFAQNSQSSGLRVRWNESVARLAGLPLSQQLSLLVMAVAPTVAAWFGKDYHAALEGAGVLVAGALGDTTDTGTGQGADGVEMRTMELLSAGIAAGDLDQLDRLLKTTRFDVTKQEYAPASTERGLLGILASEPPAFENLALLAEEPDSAGAQARRALVALVLTDSRVAESAYRTLVQAERNLQTPPDPAVADTVRTDLELVLRPVKAHRLAAYLKAHPRSDYATIVTAIGGEEILRASCEAIRVVLLESVDPKLFGGLFGALLRLAVRDGRPSTPAVATLRHMIATAASADAPVLVSLYQTAEKTPGARPLIIGLLGQRDRAGDALRDAIVGQQIALVEMNARAHFAAAVTNDAQRPAAIEAVERLVNFSTERSAAIEDAGIAALVNLAEDEIARGVLNQIFAVEKFTDDPIMLAFAQRYQRAQLVRRLAALETLAKESLVKPKTKEYIESIIALAIDDESRVVVLATLMRLPTGQRAIIRDQLKDSQAENNARGQLTRAFYAAMIRASDKEKTYGNYLRQLVYVAGSSDDFVAFDAAAHLTNIAHDETLQGVATRKVLGELAVDVTATEYGREVAVSALRVISEDDTLPDVVRDHAMDFIPVVSIEDQLRADLLAVTTADAQAIFDKQFENITDASDPKFAALVKIAVQDTDTSASDAAFFVLNALIMHMTPATEIAFQALAGFVRDGSDASNRVQDLAWHFLRQRPIRARRAAAFILDRVIHAGDAIGMVAGMKGSPTDLLLQELNAIVGAVAEQFDERLVAAIVKLAGLNPNANTPGVWALQDLIRPIATNAANPVLEAVTSSVTTYGEFKIVVERLAALHASSEPARQTIAAAIAQMIARLWPTPDAASRSGFIGVLAETALDTFENWIVEEAVSQVVIDGEDISTDVFQKMLTYLSREDRLGDAARVWLRERSKLTNYHAPIWNAIRTGSLPALDILAERATDDTPAGASARDHLVDLCTTENPLAVQTRAAMARIARDESLPDAMRNAMADKLRAATADDTEEVASEAELPVADDTADADFDMPIPLDDDLSWPDEVAPPEAAPAALGETRVDIHGVGTSDFLAAVADGDIEFDALPTQAADEHWTATTDPFGEFRAAAAESGEPLMEIGATGALDGMGVLEREPALPVFEVDREQVGTAVISPDPMIEQIAGAADVGAAPISDEQLADIFVPFAEDLAEVGVDAIANLGAVLATEDGRQRLADRIEEVDSLGDSIYSVLDRISAFGSEEDADRLTEEIVTNANAVLAMVRRPLEAPAFIFSEYLEMYLDDSIDLAPGELDRLRQQMQIDSSRAAMATALTENSDAAAVVLDTLQRHATSGDAARRAFAQRVLATYATHPGVLGERAGDILLGGPVVSLEVVCAVVPFARFRDSETADNTPYRATIQKVLMRALTDPERSAEFTAAARADSTVLIEVMKALAETGVISDGAPGRTAIAILKTWSEGNDAALQKIADDILAPLASVESVNGGEAALVWAEITAARTAQRDAINAARLREAASARAQQGLKNLFDGVTQAATAALALDAITAGMQGLVRSIEAEQAQIEQERQAALAALGNMSEAIGADIAASIAAEAERAQNAERWNAAAREIAEEAAATALEEIAAEERAAPADVAAPGVATVEEPVADVTPTVVDVVAAEPVVKAAPAIAPPVVVEEKPVTPIVIPTLPFTDGERDRWREIAKIAGAAASGNAFAGKTLQKLLEDAANQAALRTAATLDVPAAQSVRNALVSALASDKISNAVVDAYLRMLVDVALQHGKDAPAFVMLQQLANREGPRQAMVRSLVGAVEIDWTEKSRKTTASAYVMTVATAARDARELSAAEVFAAFDSAAVRRAVSTDEAMRAMVQRQAEMLSQQHDDVFAVAQISPATINEIVTTLPMLDVVPALFLKSFLAATLRGTQLRGSIKVLHDPRAGAVDPAGSARMRDCLAIVEQYLLRGDDQSLVNAYFARLREVTSQEVMTQRLIEQYSVQAARQVARDPRLQKFVLGTMELAWSHLVDENATGVAVRAIFAEWLERKGPAKNDVRALMARVLPQLTQQIAARASDALLRATHLRAFVAVVKPGKDRVLKNAITQAVAALQDLWTQPKDQLLGSVLADENSFAEIVADPDNRVKLVAALGQLKTASSYFAEQTDESLRDALLSMIRRGGAVGWAALDLFAEAIMQSPKNDELGVLLGKLKNGMRHEILVWAASAIGAGMPHYPTVSVPYTQSVTASTLAQMRAQFDLAAPAQLSTAAIFALVREPAWRDGFLSLVQEENSKAQRMLERLLSAKESERTMANRTLAMLGLTTQEQSAVIREKLLQRIGNGSDGLAELELMVETLTAGVEVGVTDVAKQFTLDLVQRMMRSLRAQLFVGERGDTNIYRKRLADQMDALAKLDVDAAAVAAAKIELEIMKPLLKKDRPAISTAIRMFELVREPQWRDDLFALLDAGNAAAQNIVDELFRRAAEDRMAYRVLFRLAMDERPAGEAVLERLLAQIAPKQSDGIAELTVMVDEIGNDLNGQLEDAVTVALDVARQIFAVMSKGKPTPAKLAAAQAANAQLVRMSESLERRGTLKPYRRLIAEIQKQLGGVKA